METNTNPLKDFSFPGIPNPASSAISITEDISRRTGSMVAMKAEKYQLMVPPQALENPAIKSIVDSKRKVEELTDDELKLVYHFISGTPLNRVFSASAVNHMARKGGKFPEYADMPEGDSLFIGDAVHKAMEVKGVNLKNLTTFSISCGEAPEKPDVSELTPDNLKLLIQMSKGDSALQAYRTVKSNKTVDEVDPKEIEAWAEDEEYTPSKELTKLINAAAKECAKVTDYLPDYRLYTDKLNAYEAKKQAVRDSGKVILDELSFRTMGADTMYNLILDTYKALKNDYVVMNHYWKGYDEVPAGAKVESFTEHVILWDHEYMPGKTVACKSMLDRLHLDVVNKVAIIQDIKTHSRLARQFVSTNYFEYGYFRSMAFYKGAVESMLQKRGYNVAEWKIYAVLLPVSTATQEVGCFNPVVTISNIDLAMGTDGGYMKPIGTKFNEQGMAQWGLDQTQFNNLASLGLIHRNAYEYYIKGWKQLIEEHEFTGYTPERVIPYAK